MLLGMEDRMPYTMESLCEIYRNGRALMSYVYMDNSRTGRKAKIIIVRAGDNEYEGIAAYDNTGTMHMMGHDKRRLMSAMKRAVAIELKK